MARFRLEDPPPEGAEVYGRLKFWRDDNGALTVKAWRGKARKPYAFYRFKTPERREAWIIEQKEGEDAREDYAAERKAKQAEQLADMLAQITPGTVLYTSWGYDQTNVDFYQVTRRVGKRGVWIRPIGAETVRATGDMSAQVKPTPDRFIGPEVRKMIGEAGVKVGYHQHARPTDPSREHYTSWYA